MTQAIFEEWLTDLNLMMKKENRKILLLIDNANQSWWDNGDEQCNCEIPSTKSDL
jgi:hypothetical protein